MEVGGIAAHLVRDFRSRNISDPFYRQRTDGLLVFRNVSRFRGFYSDLVQIRMQKCVLIAG